MALPVTMYRWDDEGAPQVVDGKPSEYMNVLKKCLVEGYGTKTGLGWSVAEEVLDPPFLALKNDINVGSGGVIMLSASSDSAGQTVTVRGCQDFIDKSTYSKSSSYFGFSRYSTNSNLMKNWIVIGTGRAFYFFCFADGQMGSNYQATYSCPAFFAGDLNSLYPNDPHTFTAFSGIKNSTSFNWNYTLIYALGEGTSANLLTLYSIDGESSATASITNLFGNRFYVTGNRTAPANITMLSPFYASMGDGSLSGSSSYQTEVMPFCRAIIPGLFLATSPGYRNDPMPVIKDIGGKNYYLLPSANSNTGCTWICLEEW
jgi:hypothetical protein